MSLTETDLFIQIVLEMIELRELDTARAVLKQTQVMGVMKQEQPTRYLKMEHLLVRSYFDPHEVWKLSYDLLDYSVFLMWLVTMSPNHEGSQLFITLNNVGISSRNCISLVFLCPDLINMCDCLYSVKS